MLQRMKNPLKDGIGRNGCVAKPCGSRKLPHGNTMQNLLPRFLPRVLDTLLETCPTNEDSVCGILFCRKEGSKDQEEEQREANEGEWLKVEEEEEEEKEKKKKKKKRRRRRRSLEAKVEEEKKKRRRFPFIANGWTHRRTGGRTDTPSHRNARAHLKNKKKRRESWKKNIVL